MGALRQMRAHALFGSNAGTFRLAFRSAVGMGVLWQRYVAVVAIYAVALHTILLGILPVGNLVAIANPLAAICHNTDIAADSPQGNTGLAPVACEHCTLCSTLAPPPVPEIAVSLVFVLAYEPNSPATPPVRNGAHSLKLARGPPQSA